MGLNLLVSSSSFDTQPEQKVYTIKSKVNPDPKKYIIEKSKIFNNFLLIQILYPNCTNYEGKKILVFENCTLNDLLRQQEIDPHFSENKRKLSPIARFEPTTRGWKMGLMFCKLTK